jgi:hypothetical protein
MRPFLLTAVECVGFLKKYCSIPDLCTFYLLLQKFAGAQESIPPGWESIPELLTYKVYKFGGSVKKPNSKNLVLSSWHPDEL